MTRTQWRFMPQRKLNIDEAPRLRAGTGPKPLIFEGKWSSSSAGTPGEDEDGNDSYRLPTFSSASLSVVLPACLSDYCHVCLSVS